MITNKLDNAIEITGNFTIPNSLLNRTAFQLQISDWQVRMTMSELHELQSQIARLMEALYVQPLSLLNLKVAQSVRHSAATNWERSRLRTPEIVSNSAVPSQFSRQLLLSRQKRGSLGKKVLKAVAT